MDLSSSLKIPSSQDLYDTYVELLSSSQRERKKLDTMEPTASQAPQQTKLPERLASTERTIESEIGLQPVQPVTIPGISGSDLMSMEDFDRLNPYDRKATLATTSGNLIPLPSAAKNSSNVVKFQHLCDSLRIVPCFEYSGDAMTGGFMATVEFGGQVVEHHGLFPSKKAAKDAVAALAIKRVDSIRGELAPMKRKRELDEIVVGQGKDERDRSENWVGILVEYTQRSKIDYPEYHEHVTESFPLRFGATVCFAGAPEPLPGSGLGSFSSKANAKAAAAKEAVLWLRHEGLVRAVPMKRVKLKTTQATYPTTIPTQAARQIHDQQSSFIQGMETRIPPCDPDEFDIDLPAPTHLHRLAASLGLMQPRFDCRSAARSPGDPVTVPLYDAAVYFDPRDVAREARLSGAIGKVERVLGQKRAKTACYELAIRHLEVLRRERREGATI